MEPRAEAVRFQVYRFILLPVPYEPTQPDIESQNVGEGQVQTGGQVQTEKPAETEQMVHAL